MPSRPRGSDVATLLAVIVAIALAFAWLGTSDGGAPAVPAGLSVGTAPTVVPEEPAALSEAAALARGIEGEKAGGERDVREGKRRVTERGAKQRHADRAARRAGADWAKRRRADRAGGGEDARARREAGARTRRGTAGEAGGQDPPATAPAPSAESGAAGGSGPAAGSGAGGAPTAPEFALE